MIRVRVRQAHSRSMSACESKPKANVWFFGREILSFEALAAVVARFENLPLVIQRVAATKAQQMKTRAADEDEGDAEI